MMRWMSVSWGIQLIISLASLLLHSHCIHMPSPWIRNSSIHYLTRSGLSNINNNRVNYLTLCTSLTAQCIHHSSPEFRAHDTVDDRILRALRVSEKERHGQDGQRQRVVLSDEIQVEADRVVRKPRQDEQDGDDDQHAGDSSTTGHYVVVRHSATSGRLQRHQADKWILLWD